MGATRQDFCCKALSEVRLLDDERCQDGANESWSLSGWVGGWVGGWKGGWVEGWVGGRVGGWVGGACVRACVGVGGCPT